MNSTGAHHSSRMKGHASCATCSSHTWFYQQLLLQPEKEELGLSRESSLTRMRTRFNACQRNPPIKSPCSYVGIRSSFVACVHMNYARNFSSERKNAYNSGGESSVKLIFSFLANAFARMFFCCSFLPFWFRKILCVEWFIERHDQFFFSFLFVFCPLLLLLLLLPCIVAPFHSLFLSFVAFHSSSFCFYPFLFLSNLKSNRIAGINKVYW